MNSLDGTKYPEVSEVNAELVRSGSKLSLEDVTSEHFTLIADSFTDPIEDQVQNYATRISATNTSPPKKFNTEESLKISHDINELIDVIPILDKSVPSPSEILKNLSLSKEDDFKELFHHDLNENSFNIDKDINDFL